MGIRFYWAGQGDNETLLGRVDRTGRQGDRETLLRRVDRPSPLFNTLTPSMFTPERPSEKMKVVYRHQLGTPLLSTGCAQLGGKVDWLLWVDWSSCHAHPLRVETKYFHNTDTRCWLPRGLRGQPRPKREGVLLPGGVLQFEKRVRFLKLFWFTL